MNNDINSFLDLKQEPIKSLDELLKIVKEYNKYIGYPKLEKIYVQDEIEKYRSQLSTGIIVHEDEVIKSIKEKILFFLTENGFSKELFESILNNVRFSITDLKTAFSSKGLAQSSGRTIFYDYSIIDFDEKGNYIGFSGENREFLSYVTTHELFHRVSAYRDDKKSVNLNDSALSEGFTEFLACLVSGYNGEKKSKTYEFSRNVCMIFSMMMGKDAMLSDYIDNIGVYPNLRNLLEYYNINFNDFVRMFDGALNKRYNKLNEELIINDERDILLLLKNSLFRPFLLDHPDNKELETEIETLLNSYGLTLQEEKTL